MNDIAKCYLLLRAHHERHNLCHTCFTPIIKVENLWVHNLKGRNSSDHEAQPRGSSMAGARAIAPDEEIIVDPFLRVSNRRGARWS